MKKIFLLSVLFAASFTLAQVTVTPESKDLNEVYQGGNDQLIEDLQKNFLAFSSDFQVNGKFILSFDLDEKGKIMNPKVSPEINNEFGYALIRSFKRVKKNFLAEMPKNNLAVSFDFTPTFKNTDGRERFTESTMTERFKANQP